MAIQLINIGNVANDGTGDDLREAFVKCNQNFEELDLLAEQSTVSNIGTGEGIFDNIVNYDIKLKTIAGGDSISLDVAEDGTITIDSDIKDIRYTTIEGDSYASAQYDFPRGRLLYSNMVQTEDDLPDASNNKGMFAAVFDTGSAYYSHANLWVKLARTSDVDLKLQQLVEDDYPTLGGGLNANGFNITAANQIDASEFVGAFTGNLTGLVNGVDPADTANYFDDYWDFGGIANSPNSIIDWLIVGVDVDFGSLNNPDARTVDLGTIAG